MNVQRTSQTIICLLRFCVYDDFTYWMWFRLPEDFTHLFSLFFYLTRPLSSTIWSPIRDWFCFHSKPHCICSFYVCRCILCLSACIEVNENGNGFECACSSWKWDENVNKQKLISRKCFAKSWSGKHRHSIARSNATILLSFLEISHTYKHKCVQTHECFLEWIKKWSNSFEKKAPSKIVTLSTTAEIMGYTNRMYIKYTKNFNGSATREWKCTFFYSL